MLELSRQGLILVGGGGHCRALVDVLETAQIAIAGVIDNALSVDDSLLGYSVIGKDSDLEGLRASCADALVSVGQIRSADVRMKLYSLLVQHGYRIPTVVSPKAHVSRHAKLDSGTVVMHMAVVNAAARIEKNCIVNSGAIVEHDCHIASHCHVAIGAKLCGGVVLEEGVFVGAGAVIREGIHIGARAIIGCGVTVKKNVPSGIVVKE